MATDMMCKWLRTWCANGYRHDVQMATDMLCKWLRTWCANGYGHDVQMATDMMCKWPRTCCANGYGHDVQMATDMMCKWQQAWCANGHGHAVQMATDMMCKWLRTWWLRTCCANGDRHDVQMATGMMCKWLRTWCGDGYGHDVQMATDMMAADMMCRWLRTWCANGYVHDVKKGFRTWLQDTHHVKTAEEMLAKPCPDSGREQRCQNGRGALEMVAAIKNSKGVQRDSSRTKSSNSQKAVLVLLSTNGRGFRFHLQCRISEQIHNAQGLNTHRAFTQFSRSTPHSANSKRSVLSWQAVKENKENVLPAHTTWQAIPHGLRSSLLIEVCFQNSKQIAETPCLVTQHLQCRIQTTSHVGSLELILQRFDSR